VHADLAWSLQAHVVSGISRRMKAAGIPFLAIHGDILRRQRGKRQACSVMEKELQRQFRNFVIAVDQAGSRHPVGFFVLIHTSSLDFDLFLSFFLSFAQLLSRRANCTSSEGAFKESTRLLRFFSIKLP